MNFEYDFMDGHTRFFYRSQPDEVLDEKTWGILTQGTANQFLLPANINQDGNGFIFTYDIAGTMNLMAWMSEAPQEKQNEVQQKVNYVLNFFAELGVPRQEIASGLQNIYIDLQTEEIKVVCVPLRSENHGFGGETDGFGNQPMVPPTPQEDFWDTDNDPGEKKSKKKKPLLKGLLHRKEKKEKEPEPEMIPDEPGNTWNPGVEPRETPPMPHPGDDIDNIWGQDKPGYTPPIPMGENPGTGYGNGPIGGGGFEETPGTGYDDGPIGGGGFGENPGTGFNFNTDSDEGNDETVMLRDDGNEATVLLKARLKPNATLIRLQTQEKFRITTEICKIGKRALMVDICIRNNPTISREHCAICFDEGEYYLEDKESSNYTYLNGNRVMPRQKELLNDGDQIRISDEEFIFRKGDVK